MSKIIEENRPLSIYTLLAPHVSWLWRLLASAGLLALAIMLSR